MTKPHHTPYIPIPASDLPRMMGAPIHLRGMPYGCTWILMRVDGDTLHLRTPKTRKLRTARASDALYARTREPKEDDTP